MRKPIYRFSLIKERLTDNQATGFLSSLFSQQQSKVDLFLKVPHYDVLRAEMFIEDLIEITELTNFDYGIEDLINTLYDDFLMQIRQGVALSQIHAYLQQKQTQIINPRAEELIRMEENRWSLEEVPSEERKIRLKITISRKAALRGEIFLYDMSAAYPTFQLTLEQLLAILFIDFVSEIKKGNQTKFIQALLSRYE